MTSYLSEADFLTGITGGTEDFHIEGVGTIRIRALEYQDVARIDREAQGDSMRAGFLLAAAAIMEPALTPEGMQQLEHARPGVLLAITRRVNEISGLGDQENLEKKAGIGS